MEPADISKIEEALTEVLLHGWGSVEIVVNRGRVTGFRLTIQEKLKNINSDQGSNDL